MNEQYVEICERYEGAILVRKTANGVDLPLNSPELPVVAIQRISMTRESFEKIYGKDILREK